MIMFFDVFVCVTVLLFIVANLTLGSNCKLWPRAYHLYSLSVFAGNTPFFKVAENGVVTIYLLRPLR